MEIRVDLDGGDAFKRALAAKMVALDDAASHGTNEAMTIVHREIADQLNLSSHPPGTPTPSVPPMPPSRVTGDMIRSIQEVGPYYVGPHSTEGIVGPGAVQSRIHELGGDINNAFGLGITVHMPARPYVAPAVEIARPLVVEAFRAAFTEAVS